MRVCQVGVSSIGATNEVNSETANGESEVMFTAAKENSTGVFIQLGVWMYVTDVRAYKHSYVSHLL